MDCADKKHRSSSSWAAAACTHTHKSIFSIIAWCLHVMNGSFVSSERRSTVWSSCVDRVLHRMRRFVLRLKMDDATLHQLIYLIGCNTNMPLFSWGGLVILFFLPSISTFHYPSIRLSDISRANLGWSPLTLSRINLRHQRGALSGRLDHLATSLSFHSDSLLFQSLVKSHP